MLKLGVKKKVFECQACFRMCSLVYYDNSDVMPRCPFPLKGRVPEWKKVK